MPRYDTQRPSAKSPTGRRVYGRRRDKASFAVVAALVGILAIGGTVAWITDRDDPVRNDFLPADVTCAVGESFDGRSKADVHVHNTGDVDAFVRVALVATWTDGDGGVFAQAPVEGVDYELVLAPDSGWTQAVDGYYYYAEPVAPAGAGGCGIAGCETEGIAGFGFTGDLIESCRVLAEAPREGYTLHVDVIASAIQAHGKTRSDVPAVMEAWPTGVSGVNADGTLDIIEAA